MDQLTTPHPQTTTTASRFFIPSHLPAMKHGGEKQKRKKEKLGEVAKSQSKKASYEKALRAFQMLNGCYTLMGRL